MSLYKLLSIFNIAFFLVDLFLMIRLVINWNTPKVFWRFYYYMVTLLLLWTAGLFYSFALKGFAEPKWWLRIHSLWFGIMILDFIKAIKAFSTRKIK